MIRCPILRAFSETWRPSSPKDPMTSAVATDSPLILLHPSDDVAVTRRTIPQGLEIPLPDGSTVRAGAVIASDHKVAVKEVAPGQPVRKFGQVIGQATVPVRPGDWV